MVLVYILAAVILVSLISLIGIMTLSTDKKFLKKALPIMIAFAAGTLLATAFFDFLPEAVEHITTPIEQGFIFTLVGLLLFFIVERFVFWHHCHNGKCDTHTFTYMNLIGDAIHNILDGVVIAAGFLHSIPVATLAIMFHEIPQEIGDFSILLHGGFSRNKALAYNFLVALTSVVGAIVTYYFVTVVEGFIPSLLFLAAGGFIYIAAADIFPEIRKEKEMKNGLKQLVALLLGILVIWWVNGLFPHI
jgi:zinc and cadmium transporter